MGARQQRVAQISQCPSGAGATIRAEPPALSAHPWTIGTPPSGERYALIIESGLEARDQDRRDSDLHR